MQKLVNAPRVENLHISWSNKVRHYLPQSDGAGSPDQGLACILPTAYLYRQHPIRLAFRLRSVVSSHLGHAFRASSRTTSTSPVASQSEVADFQERRLRGCAEVVGEIVVSKSRAGKPLEHVKFEKCAGF